MSELGLLVTRFFGSQIFEASFSTVTATSRCAESPTNDFLRKNCGHRRQRTPPRYFLNILLYCHRTNLCPGRLASTVAKQILNGQHIVLVRCEDINISGEFFRNKLKFHAYLRKRCRYNPTRVPSHIPLPVVLESLC